MIYLLYGFLFGFVIPYIARRFNKFMPATLGYGIYKILKPVKISKKTNQKKQALKKKYLYRSVLIGVVTAIVFYAISIKFGSYGLVLKLLFIWLLILLAEIDYRMMLLPDIITFPLTLFGFFACTYGMGFVDINESVMAALFGYFMPVIASLFVVWKNKDMFGGGDIKLLAAFGAWLGFLSLLYIIILASISFFVYALVNKQKEGAFGPWLCGSCFVVLMLF